jgi:autotransporter-associated beta strand protein
MKPIHCPRFLAISIVALVAHSASAATITKAATGTDLNDGASWVGGVVPGASDIATWDSASLCTGLSQTGTRYWGGISVGSASSDIDISGYGWLEFADGAGIDMSASTKNLTLGTTYFVAIHNSTWTVNEGKTLTVGATPDSVELYYYGGSILTVGGAGNTVLNAYCRTSGYTLTKTGTGTLTTTSQLRNYGGNVNVEGGVLSVQASQFMDGYYSASGAITVSGGGVLELQNWGYGYDQNLGGLWYDNSAIVINGGTIRMNNTVATGDGRNFTIGSGGATLEANGGNNLWLHTGAAPNNSANGALTLSGAGNGQMDKSLPGTAATATLTKSGTGTWTLTGANSYSGATTVSDGKLLVNGSITGAGAVSVASGATLGGTGTIAGAMIVNGVLSPGASIESLATGALTLNGGSTFMYEMNSTANAYAADLQKVTGDLTLSLTGTVGLTLTDEAGTPTAFAQNTVLSLINYSGAWNGGYFTYGANQLTDGEVFISGLNTWQIRYGATTGGLNFASEATLPKFVNLTAVPEPGSLFAIGCLVGSGVLLRSRRRAV